MPTYEYACKKCGEHFDVVQSFADDPLKRHKGGCGGAVKRVFGSVGISFKGSGFYKNDSRSSSSNGSKSSSSSESSESKSETKSESKSETKSETKSESKSDKKSDKKPASSTT
jgi:putative FmdB family regulatory protein